MLKGSNELNSLLQEHNRLKLHTPWTNWSLYIQKQQIRLCLNEKTKILNAGLIIIMNNWTMKKNLNLTQYCWEVLCFFFLVIIVKHTNWLTDENGTALSFEDSHLLGTLFSVAWPRTLKYHPSVYKKTQDKHAYGLNISSFFMTKTVT